MASEQLGESGRIAVQKASYFAEGSHAELDGLSNESNADRSEIPSSGKGTQSLEADMVLLTDSLAELFKCQPATRLAWIHEDLARVVAGDRELQDGTEPSNVPKLKCKKSSECKK